MIKNRIAALLFLVPLTFLVACATLLDVDFGAAHLDDDASISNEGGTVTGEGGKAACLPKTCQMQGLECGTQNDTCGEALNCGTCKTGVCTAGKCACVPKTCPQLKVTCGKVDNGCGGILDCGGCTNPSDACDSTTNSCQCKPKNCTEQGAECGTVPDGCGQTYACGDCAANPKGTYCTAGKCGATPCTPKTCAQLGKNCGQVSDGCSTVLTCTPGCTGPQTCGGGGVANVCGCTPKTCAQLGATCGSIGDGCGGTLSCGSCTAPQTCGGGGAANTCGCTPTGMCPPGSNCGTVPNGCGGNTACGAACVSPNTCGGGGSANVCGCTKLTCDDYVCGLNVSDGCGGHLNCGSCACFAGETPVLMADGSLRPISKLVPGDMIMGFDPGMRGPVPRKVESLSVHPAEDSAAGTMVLNGAVRATLNHPFLSAGRRVRADQLKVGDVLHVAELQGGHPTLRDVPITTITRAEGNIVTYDVVTSPPGGYVVGKNQYVVLQKIPL
jgi:hypothetical protein